MGLGCLKRRAYDLDAVHLSAWERARLLLPLKGIDEADLLDRLLTKRAHLWISADSAGVTEITDNNTLHVWLAGGTLAGLLDMLADVEGFARVLGCRAVELSGRKGWHRVMTKYGFVRHGQEMLKVLNER